MATNSKPEPVELEWLKCEGCSGTGVYSSQDELGGVSTNSACPDCQGTGLRFPGLTKECWICQGPKAIPYYRLEVSANSIPCNNCQGTKRIPVTGSEAVLALMKALLKVNGSSGIYIQPTIRGTYMVSFTVADKVYESDTLEAALSQALAAAGEVAGG